MKVANLRTSCLKMKDALKMLRIERYNIIMHDVEQYKTYSSRIVSISISKQENEMM